MTWTARRRYPRALRGEIPILVSFGVPFLTEGGPGVSPSNLEWSYRTTGTRRASLESYSPWSAATMALLPLVRADFDTNGPHQLVLQARVRTVGLTSLATGYGNLTLKDFAEGICPLMSDIFMPIEEVRICLFEDYRVRELSGYLPEAVIAK